MPTRIIRSLADLDAMHVVTPAASEMAAWRDVLVVAFTRVTP